MAAEEAPPSAPEPALPDPSQLPKSDPAQRAMKEPAKAQTPVTNMDANKGDASWACTIFLCLMQKGSPQKINHFHQKISEEYDVETHSCLDSCFTSSVICCSFWWSPSNSSSHRFHSVYRAFEQRDIFRNISFYVSIWFRSLKQSNAALHCILLGKLCDVCPSPWQSTVLFSCCHSTQSSPSSTCQSEQLGVAGIQVCVCSALCGINLYD